MSPKIFFTRLSLSSEILCLVNLRGTQTEPVVDLHTSNLKMLKMQKMQYKAWIRLNSTEKKLKSFSMREDSTEKETKLNQSSTTSTYKNYQRTLMSKNSLRCSQSLVRSSPSRSIKERRDYPCTVSYASRTAIAQKMPWSQWTKNNYQMVHSSWYQDTSLREKMTLVSKDPRSTPFLRTNPRHSVQISL